MVRKLLKRKLRIVNLKKLKTIKRIKTSLGQFALKQVSKKRVETFLTYYPKQPYLLSNLHRKELLSQLYTSFFLKQKLNKLGNLVQRKETGNLIGNEKQSAKVFLRSAQHPVQHKVQNVLNLQDKDKQKKVIRFKPKNFFYKKLSISQPAHLGGVWPLYTLNFKSETKKPYSWGSNFKNIYSLDQLMVHQYDAQFRRRQSKHKASLLENQKLTALYGKLTQKQKVKLMQTLSKTHKKTAPQSAQVAYALESRLDVTLKQGFAFTTLRNAQHWISQGRVCVNHKPVTSPSHTLQPGDLVAISAENLGYYKNFLLNQFYKYPKESKYVQSGRLLTRWKEWATLYNNLSSNHQWLPANRLQAKGLMVSDKTKIGKNYESTNENTNEKTREYTKIGNRFLGNPIPSLDSINKENTRLQHFRCFWPDKAIRDFWYLNGRNSLDCLYKSHKFHNKKSLGTNNLLRWLKKQRWPRMSLRYRYWKLVYRRRLLVFSRWLLSTRALTRDGLYKLRWQPAFIRKKSYKLKTAHRSLSLQKPLHLEVSYKKLCALYLYPPQRIVWPCMIDFKKV